MYIHGVFCHNEINGMRVKNIWHYFSFLRFFSFNTKHSKPLSKGLLPCDFVPVRMTLPINICGWYVTIFFCIFSTEMNSFDIKMMLFRKM